MTDLIIGILVLLLLLAVTVIRHLNMRIKYMQETIDELTREKNGISIISKHYPR